MATEGQGRAPAASQLTALPKIEEIPRAGDGLDESAVREAFEVFRRHTAQLQAQLRVLQAAGARAGNAEPSGHALRMDALHLIRAAAEFADTIERDAQNATAAQLARVEQEITRRHSHVKELEREVERQRADTDRQRADTLNTARNEARELLAKAQADAARELQEAEARGAKLLEQARHQATELTNAARAEVEQTLEWARAQAQTVIGRAQHGAEQLLGAAGLSPDKVGEVAAAIMRSAEHSGQERPLPPTAALAGAPDESEPETQGSEPSEPRP